MRSLSPSSFAFLLVLVCALLASCATAKAPRPDLSPAADQAFPPPFWPEDCGVSFAEAAPGSDGMPAAKAVVFGQECILSGIVVLEDGSVAARKLDLGKGLFPLADIVLKALPGTAAGSGTAELELGSEEGFSLSLTGWRREGKALVAEGLMGLGARAGERAAPGRCISLSASVSDLPLAARGPRWTKARVGELRIGFRSEAGTDEFSAPSGLIRGTDGRPRLAFVALAGGSGDLSFPEFSLAPDGSVTFGKGSAGALRRELGDGSLVALSGILPAGDGSWLAEGEAELPPSSGGGKLFLAAGSVRLTGLSGPSGTARCADPTLSIAYNSWQLALPNASVSFSGEGLGLECESSTASFGGIAIPLGSLVRGADGTVRTAGAKFEATALPLGGGGFKASSASFDGRRLYLAGSLSFPEGLPAAAMDADGLAAAPDLSAQRIAGLPPQTLHAFGVDWSVAGLSLSATGIGFERMSCALAGGRSLSFEGFAIDASGAGAPSAGARSGRVECFVGQNPLLLDRVAWSREGGLSASGSGMVEFALSSQVFRKLLSVEGLGLGAGGKLSVGRADWAQEPIHAFLGLTFGRADFALRDGRPFVLLSGGSFRFGGIFPSGGEVDGLGLDIAAQSYDRSSLSFGESASFTWRGASFELSGFDSLLDDDYVFTGRALLPPLPGAPWEAGQSLPLRALRMNGYGQVLSAIVECGGKRIELRDALPESAR